jgi:menaquinone-specific isochorismate synthase
MTILPLDPAANPTPDALRAFLAQCRAAAAGDGRQRLASISIEVPPLDPLAVLESIFEPAELHFYAERPAEDWAVAGAEAVLTFEAGGPDRFAAGQRFVDEVLARTIAVGETGRPFGGPHFFGAYSFFDDTEAGEPFPAVRLFVPRWQVSRAHDRTIAVANLLVDPDADLDALVAKVWRAHGKFRAFEYGTREHGGACLGGTGLSGTGVPPVGVARASRPWNPQNMGETPMPLDPEHGGDAHATGDPQNMGGTPMPLDPDHGRDAHATGDDVMAAATEADAYRAAVAQAVAMIAEGQFEKIVIARCREVTAAAALHPLKVLNALRQRFPDCYAFSFANGRGQSFIGASPERLLRVEQGTLLTEALAGSAPRGLSASEDAALGGALLADEKELREHRHVIASIDRRLAPLGLQLMHAARPGLKRLANVQHLHTPVSAALPAGVRLLDVLARLHPTPAVGGSPRAAACAHIRELEGFSRGLYCGPVGWLDHRGGGEFLVGIRSALIDGARVRAYAGGGIVAGSDPDREFAETELKFKALLEALGS